jgi:hypothetical protein
MSVNAIQTFDKIKQWMQNPDLNYEEIFPTFVGFNYDFHLSYNIKRLITPTTDAINLIGQFYIDKNEARQNEIRETLFLNVNNESINKIYLFNERDYTADELGVTSDKIIQIVVGERLSFENIFKYVETYKIQGYIVIANSDIFFDKSIDKIRTCEFKKDVLTLVRYEYDGISSLKDAKLFDNGRPDSQDAWIYHSDYNIKPQLRKCFNFYMGKPGCDNKLIYLFNIFGYKCYNEPRLVKIYHNHNVPSRNYNSSDKVPHPYYVIFPSLSNNETHSSIQSFDCQVENETLYNYIQSKVSNNNPFIIPRVAGIENETALLGIILSQQKTIDVNVFNSFCGTMKNNAGIKIDNYNHLILYSKLYLEAFKQADIYLNWTPWCIISKFYYNSINFIHANFKQQRILATTMDVFNYIENERIWTQALSGKRILIISSFIDSIQSVIHNRAKIYGVDLFPNCEFVFLKPPQTQGKNQSRDFIAELNDFVGDIIKIRDTFDVALVSCGGYGNLVCSQIYKMNKSAIYVGGVLQMFFGVYGSRWEKDRPMILDLYKNEFWSRPKENERPEGYSGIEGSCYW